MREDQLMRIGVGKDFDHLQATIEVMTLVLIEHPQMTLREKWRIMFAIAAAHERRSDVLTHAEVERIIAEQRRPTRRSVLR